MHEMILRINDISTDVEVLVNNFVTSEILEKKISFKTLLSLLSKQVEKDDSEINCKFFNHSIIGYGSIGNKEIYVIDQPEHKRYITYSVGKDNQAYHINFPSSIYVVEVANKIINHIKAFMYLEYKGKETKLYEYAMANMLSDNKICIGNADRQIESTVINALEKIIYAPYSHAELNNIKGFKSTKSYFEYLTDNHISEKYLIKTNKKLGDILNGGNK